MENIFCFLRHVHNETLVRTFHTKFLFFYYREKLTSTFSVNSMSSTDISQIQKLKMTSGRKIHIMREKKQFKPNFFCKETLILFYFSDYFLWKLIPPFLRQPIFQFWDFASYNLPVEWKISERDQNRSSIPFYSVTIFVFSTWNFSKLKNWLPKKHRK